MKTRIVEVRKVADELLVTLAVPVDFAEEKSDRRCVYCKKILRDTLRIDAKYCSNSCRSQAYYGRQNLFIGKR